MSNEPISRNNDNERLDKIEASCRRIETALIGEPALGHIGIVQRISDHDAAIKIIRAELDAARSQKKGAVAVLAAASAVAGSVGGFVTWLFSMRGSS